MSGMRAKPENTVGIPMTRPENVDVPPKCSAYRFEEDTIMKKDICINELFASIRMNYCN